MVRGRRGTGYCGRVVNVQGPLKVTGFYLMDPVEYPDNVLWLSEFVDPDDADPNFQPSLLDVPGRALVRRPVVLTREPHNPVDPNAVLVWIPGMGDGGFSELVGYLTSVDAQLVGPRLAGGDVWEAWVAGVPVHPDHLDFPGLEIYIRWA